MTAHQIFLFLVFFTGKATMLLVFGLVCLCVSRASNASARHLICASALTSAALLPALMLLLPSIPIVPSTMVWLRIPATASQAAGLNPHLAANLEKLATLAWLGGLAFVLVRLVLGRAMLRKQLANAQQVEGAEWHSCFESAARDLGLGPSGIALRRGSVAAPLACGVLRPGLLLPASASQWTALQRRSVLLHELAHIKRRDCLWQLVGQFTCALLWFHPLAWMLQSKLRREEELACDDAVLSAGIAPPAYAEVLLQTARTLHSPLLFACGMSGKGRAADIRNRFAHLLDASLDHRLRAAGARRLVHVFAVLVFALSFANPLTADVYKIGGDVSAPKLTKKVEPEYTVAAKKAKIQGTVLLSVVVGKNGIVQKVTVERSLDPGLDEKAVQAVKAWRFSPALRKGRPVPVQAKIEVNFRLL